MKKGGGEMIMGNVVFEFGCPPKLLFCEWRRLRMAENNKEFQNLPTETGVLSRKL